MKNLILLALFVSVSSAHASTPIELQADDARVMTKILKMIGAPSRSPNDGITQYTVAKTGCVSQAMEIDGMPSYSCTSETVVTRLTEELSATVLFESLYEAGVQDEQTATGDAINVNSITCTVDTQGESTCVIDPVLDPPAPTVAATPAPTPATDDTQPVGSPI